MFIATWVSRPEDHPKWDAFESKPRVDDDETKEFIYDLVRKMFKVVTIVFCFLVVLGGAAVHKTTILFAASQVGLLLLLLPFPFPLQPPEVRCGSSWSSLVENKPSVAPADCKRRWWGGGGGTGQEVLWVLFPVDAGSMSYQILKKNCSGPCLHGTQHEVGTMKHDWSAQCQYNVTGQVSMWAYDMLPQWGRTIQRALSPIESFWSIVLRTTSSLRTSIGLYHVSPS